MRVLSLMIGLTTLAASTVFCASAAADEGSQLVQQINEYRSQVQRCGDQGSQELPPLTSDTRLVLPATNAGDLQQELARTAYPMVNVQAISLSGPKDAQSAMKAVRESFCRVVLDPQFIDIGVSNSGQDWRIVLARPLLSSGLGDWQTEGRKLLEMINAARAQPRQCGTEAFAATTPLAWNDTLAEAANSHTRNMANGNFFD
ncbi:hypothetical protein AO262_36920, partial [Pseudomonas fluorescens ABAC62]